MTAPQGAGVPLPEPPSVMPAYAARAALVDDCCTSLRAACARLDDLGTFTSGPARLDDWVGSSGDVYRLRTRALGRRAEAMALALRRVAARVEDHAETLADLGVLHADLVTRSTSLAGGIEVLRRDVARATPAGLASLGPVLHARSVALRASIADYEHDRRRWLHRLFEEEQAMVAAFERLHSMRQVRDRFAGLPDPADRALRDLPAVGSPPREALAWWRSLSPAERAALLVAAPGVLGNRDGLPVRVRHRANEVRLERDLAGLRSLRERGDLTDREKQVLRNAEAAAAARDEAEQTRDPQTGEPVPVRLLLYDPTAFGGDGAVALGVGDPDIADDISVLVPGLGTDGADIPGLTAHATSVYEAARDADPGASHASIAWIGYDAPDNIPVRDGLAADAAGVVREDLAERGGAALAQAVDGLRASREGEPADVTVIGHSYGSTTAGHAAHDQGLAADDLVFVGSPGVGGGVDDTADLGMSSQHVWAAANSHDVVPHLAGRGSIDLGLLGGIGLGNDPAEDDFGAIRFQAESGSGSETGAHSGYFEDGSESLDNLAHIVTGQYGLVDRAPGVTDPWWGPPRDPELGRSPRPGPSRAA